MDKEKITKLAQDLRKIPEENFDMGVYTETRSCGTVACIAGWALLLVAKENWEDILDMRSAGIHNRAAEALSLDDDIAEALFIPTGAGWLATPADAANVLDNLVATGEVDWGLVSVGEE